MLGGRGAGKTRALAEWVIEQQAAGKRRIALVAPTAADTRNVLVEGPSGVMACAPAYSQPVYNPSLRRLTWSNGAVATLYSADEPERLRGPQHDAAAVDELAAWRRPEAWDQLMFGLRLGDKPKCVIATTPRPVKVLKDLLAREGRDVVVSRASSYDNRANLAQSFFDQITKRYEGTRLGRQELLAEMLSDYPGALWNRDRIEQLRRDAAPQFRRVVVAIDPSGGSGEEHDEVGIVACGVDEADHGWVLADASGHYAPHEWAKAAIQLYHTLAADRIAAETNYGGDMVESVLRSIDPNVPFTAVHASRGKVARAEPIAALYEQGRVHHLGVFPELEDEMACFTPGGLVGSPNRVDALVWCLTDLMAQPMASWGIFEFTRRAAIGDPIRPTTRPLIDVYNETAARIQAGLLPFAPSDNRTEWRKRYDAIAASETPSHPEARGGTIEHVNGPLMKPSFAPGSVEWQQQQDRKS